MTLTSSRYGYGDALLDWLRWLNDFIRRLESVVANLVATIAPWLAPIIPANMTMTNLRVYLHFDGNIPLIGGLLVEFLGFATLNTSLEFWYWNRRHSKNEKKQMPFWLAIGSFVVYLLVIIVVNVLLDATQLIHNANMLIAFEILARLLLTTLTIPAGTTIAIRKIYSDVLDKKSGKLPVTYQKVTGNSVKFREVSDWRKLTQEERKWCIGRNPKEIVAGFGCEPRTALNWSKKDEQTT